MNVFEWTAVLEGELYAKSTKDGQDLGSVRESVLGAFPAAVTKHIIRSYLKEEEVFLCSVLGGASIMVGKAWRQNREVAGHIVSAAKKLRAT